MLELLPPGAVASGSASSASRGVPNAVKTPRYGKVKFTIPPGSTLLAKVKLNGKAKRLVRKSGSLPAILRLTPDGGAPTVADLVVTQ